MTRRQLAKDALVPALQPEQRAQVVPVTERRLRAEQP